MTKEHHKKISAEEKAAILGLEEMIREDQENGRELQQRINQETLSRLEQRRIDPVRRKHPRQSNLPKKPRL